MNSLTFIIPSIGRDSLKRTLESIHNQTDDDWNALVVFDHVEPTIDETDKVKFIVTPTKGGKPGPTRNAGMKHGYSPWYAFVDDDDYILPTYIERLKYYEEINPGVSLISFAFHDQEQNLIIPRPNTPALVKNNIGASFAVRGEIPHTHGVWFNEKVARCEDFMFIKSVYTRRFPVIFSGDVQYIVPKRSWNI